MYFLNFMGPMSHWYDKNNVPYDETWCCGRIDVEDGTTFGAEISVPVMSQASWAALGNWLWNLETEEPLLDLEDIVNLFEKETGAKLVWFDS